MIPGFESNASVAVGPLRHRPVPRFVYHYSSADGLVGILESRELWATHIGYLNDDVEFKLAQPIATEAIDDLVASDDNATSAVGDAMRQLLEAPHLVNVCVASFCEEGDDLSLWRGYTRPGSAFSIGLVGGWLESIRVGGSHWRLMPCFYDEEEHQQLIEWLVADAHDSLRRGLEEHGDPWLQEAASSLFLERFLILSPLVKHHSFKAEREWRLISPALPTEALSVRSAGGRLVPHVRVPLPSRIRELKVVVGPSVDGRQARAAEILVAQAAEWSEVTRSASPYRYW